MNFQRSGIIPWVKKAVSTMMTVMIRLRAIYFIDRILFSSFFVEQFYWADPRSALRGGVTFSQWPKNSGKSGAGQLRNGLRLREIERGWEGREYARGRLYAGFWALRNADLVKWASRRPFRPENYARKAFSGRKWLATELTGWSEVGGGLKTGG